MHIVNCFDPAEGVVHCACIVRALCVQYGKLASVKDIGTVEIKRAFCLKQESPCFAKRLRGKKQFALIKYNEAPAARCTVS